MPATPTAALVVPTLARTATTTTPRVPSEPRDEGPNGPMNRRALGGAVIAMAAVAAVVFAGVGIHELNYASDHPYAYGPAKVIAWGAGAGALLSVALGVLGFALVRDDRR